MRRRPVPGELVASKESNLAVGETTKIGGDDFKVVGLTESRTIFGGTPLLFMDIADVQELVYQGQDVATAIVVNGDVANPPSGFEAKTVEETWKDALRPLEKPVGAIDVVQILLWLVAATIIGAVVYLSALERKRDFAVMKAVGASSRGLLAGLATQSVIIALVAARHRDGDPARARPGVPDPRPGAGARVHPAADPRAASPARSRASADCAKRSTSIRLSAFAGPGA